MKKKIKIFVLCSLIILAVSISIYFGFRIIQKNDAVLGDSPDIRISELKNSNLLSNLSDSLTYITSINEYLLPDNSIVNGVRVISRNNIFAYTDYSILHFNGSQWKKLYENFKSKIFSMDTDGEYLIFSTDYFSKSWKNENIFISKVLYNKNDVTITNPENRIFNLFNSFQNKFISPGCAVLIGEHECCLAYFNYNALKNKVIIDQKTYPFLPPQKYYVGARLCNENIQKKKHSVKFKEINLMFIDGYVDPSLVKAELGENGFVFKPMNIKNFISERNDNLTLSSLCFPDTNIGVFFTNIGVIIYKENYPKNNFHLIRSPLKVYSTNNEFIPVLTENIYSFCVMNNKIFVLTLDKNIIMGIINSYDNPNVKWKIIWKTDLNSTLITPINSSDEILVTGNNSYIIKIKEKEQNNKDYIRKVDFKNVNNNSKIFLTIGALSGSVYGMTIGDYNNDGNEDIYFIDMLRDNCLFFGEKNDITQTISGFFNTAIEHGLSGKLKLKSDVQENYDICAVSCDINEDGNQDVVVSQLMGPNLLYVNNGKGYFRNKTIDYNINVNIKRSEGIAIADINNDGYLDLLMLSFLGKNRLFLNKNGVEFEDITDKSGLDSLGASVCAVFGDINGDGYPDLYIGNWVNENKFYLNNGKNGFEGNMPVFHDYTKESGTGCGILKKTNSVLLADFNNDGKLDIFVGNRGDRNRLFFNNESTNFTDASDILNKDIYGSDSTRLYTYGSVFADFDMDGWLDIFISTLNNIKLYKNMGEEQSFQLRRNNINKPIIKFIDATDNYFIKHSYHDGYNTGVVTIDNEMDGDIDIVVGQNGKPSFILKNLLNNPLDKKKNFIEFKITGSKSNRDGIGVKLRLYKIDTSKQNRDIDVSGTSPSNRKMIAFREIFGGYGYAGSSSKIQHFGIPDTNAKYELEVEFPASGVIKRMGIELGTFMEIREYEGLEEFYYLTIKGLKRFVVTSENWRIFFEFFILALVLSFIMFRKNNILRTSLFEGIENIKISTKKKIRIIMIPLATYPVILLFLGYLIDIFLGDNLWILYNSSLKIMGITKEIVALGLAGAVLYFTIKNERDKIFKSAIGLEIHDKLYIMLRQFQHGESMMMNLNRLAFFSENIKGIFRETNFDNTIPDNIKQIVERYITAVEEFNKFVNPQIISIAKLLDILEKTNNEENILKAGNKSSINLLKSNEELLIYINTFSSLIKKIIDEKKVSDDYLVQIDLLKNKVMESIDQIKIIACDIYRILGKTIECSVEEVISTTIKKFKSDNRSQKYELEYLKENNNDSLKARIPSIILNEILSILIQNSFDAFSSCDQQDVNGNVSNNKLLIFIQLFLGNNKINIGIEDNGPGIPIDLYEEIFKDGFTTKQGNRGFGLAYAKSNLEKHGGSIKCLPNKLNGARFVIELVKGEE